MDDKIPHDWFVKYYRVMYKFIICIRLKKQMLNIIVHNYVPVKTVVCHQSWDVSQMSIV